MIKQPTVIYKLIDLQNKKNTFNYNIILSILVTAVIIIIILLDYKFIINNNIINDKNIINKKNILDVDNNKDILEDDKKRNLLQENFKNEKCDKKKLKKLLMSPYMVNMESSDISIKDHADMIGEDAIGIKEYIKAGEGDYPPMPPKVPACTLI